MPNINTCFETWKEHTNSHSIIHKEPRNIMTKNNCIPFQETKYVVLSSCLFFIPSFYALYYNFLVVGCAGLVTTTASINYWRDCKSGWSRNCDLIASRTMCGIGSYYYLINIKTQYDYIIFILLYMILQKAYNMADFKNMQWVKYHIFFHCTLTISGILTINKMIKK